MSEIANYFLYRNAEGETGLSANSIDDLNLDDLFAEIDYCHSSIGRQYLYYLLLSDKTSGMEKQEALLSSLATHTELRTLLSNALKELDKPDAYSIVSILENDNTGIGAKEMVLINICRFLPLLFLALMLLTHSGVFLTLFVFSFVANAVLHYRNKAKIQRYFFSIPQLLKMIRQAGKLAQNKEFVSVDPSITTDLKDVEGLKKYISYFRFNLSLDNDMAILFYMAAELIRVFFLHEAYAVGRTFHLLKEKATAIHNVYRFIGFVDSILSVAILREELPYYCLPGDNRAGEKLNEILTNFLSTDATFESPYTEVRPVTRVAVVVFSSNSSLCGAFNANVVKKLGETLEEYKSLGKENILIYPVGKKVEQAVKKLGYTSQGSYQGMADKPSYMQAYELAALLMQEFMEKQIDRVELIYHHFKSMGSQILMREEYLPIDLSKVAATAATEGSGKRGFQNDYIVEPSVGQLIADLLPKVLSQKLFTVLQDSNASEHAARTLAMQTATDNANELIQDLTKQYNKSRQQAITNELLDIIAGSLK